MRVIGTAGHVDHGKSTLVEALSGINPDRLKEEQEREMTIDLGFAWITLPSGREASIVDVPGHEDFIKNMLAGVSGIDLAMLVIAADEAVMPQTREHLAILDLLRVPRGVVALTKIDLIDEPEWVELVRAEIEEVLASTSLAGAPIVALSARTGAGLEELRGTLDRLLMESTPRADLGRPRLPVDRAFTISGFGTVVTGTLSDGAFAVGDEVEVLPEGRRARIRGLQSHKQKVERVGPGRRAALNLSGIDVAEIRRGDVVARPGVYLVTTLVDVALNVVADAAAPVRHNQAFDFFSGAAEAPAHIRLIGERELPPGGQGFAQLRLASPMALARGDRFILRLPSPSRTVGGGIILDAHPARRWRRFRPESVQRFRLLAEGSPADLLLQRLENSEPADEASLVANLPFPAGTAGSALEELLAEGRARRLDDGSLLSARGWTRLTGELTTILAEYHRQFPLRYGMPREELASRLNLRPKPFSAFLEASGREGLAAESGGVVRLPEHTVQLRPEQERAVAALLAEFEAAPYMPPNAGDAQRAVGEELLNLLLSRGDLVRVSADVLLGPAVYEEMTAFVVEQINARGGIVATEVRDRFNTSRKYAIALLEHLDNKRVTRRIGDTRVLR